MASNTTGFQNTILGAGAMINADGGTGNVGVGNATLQSTSGSYNTALGRTALALITTGNNNIGLGIGAGLNLTSGESNNIEIGNYGVTGESNTIRIGRDTAEPNFGGAPHTATYIAGIYNDPAAIPPNIPPAGSEPVYVGPDGRLYGDPTAPKLASISPDEWHTMQQTIEEQKATIEQQRVQFDTQVAQQQKTLDSLTAQMKAQNDQLQRVTVRMQQQRSKPQTVANRK